MTETFNPQAELSAVREKRAMKRRKTYRRSKLEKYRAEILALRHAGASAADIVEWLRGKHCKIHRSSVDRFLTSGKVGEITEIEDTPAPGKTSLIANPQPLVYPLSPSDNRQ